MGGSLHDDRLAWSWPRLLGVGLLVALLAALADVSRLRAQDTAREPAQTARAARETEGHRPSGHRRHWPMIGHDARNTRHQPFEWRIGCAPIPCEESGKNRGRTHKTLGLTGRARAAHGLKPTAPSVQCTPTAGGG
jgi:hypothetical protein